MPAPRDLAIEARGLRFHVVEHPAEDPAAPTVVLLHGFLDHARLFDGLASRLRGFRVLAPDARGHGSSGHVGAGGYYHFADYLADLHALLERLAPGGVRLVGHSMGGSTAVYFAGTFPERVERLALIEGLGPPAQQVADTPLRVRGWIDDLAKVDARPPKVFATVEEAAARVRQNNPALAASHALHYAKFATRPVAGGVGWSFDPLHQTRAPQVFQQEIFQAFASRITCPTLVIEGERGFVLADEQRAPRLASFRDVRAIRIAEAGHHVHLDAPDAVAAALNQFLV